MRVIPIKDGSIVRDGAIIISASSSVSLIESERNLIIIDTGQPGEEALIQDSLASKGFAPSDIDIVLNTHLHMDHIGCNDLFENAIFFADPKENPPIHFRKISEGEELSPGVEVISTPGHTAGSISVIAAVEDKKYAIVGDAIPTYENFEKMMPPAINIDEQLAINSMKRIIESTDIIIPGHGAMFEIVR